MSSVNLQRIKAGIEVHVLCEMMSLCCYLTVSCPTNSIVARFGV